MTRQELIAFLDREAEQAMLTVLPKILEDIEKNLVPNGKSSWTVQMEPLVSNYKDPNVQTVIINKAVEKLEALGYSAHSHTQGGIFPSEPVVRVIIVK